MKEPLIVMIFGFVFLSGFFIGAFAHEKDMERNFLKTGDARAWFSDIKCDVK